MVWLREPFDFLKVQQLRHAWVTQDVMASAHPRDCEPEGFGKSHRILEPNVARPVEDEAQRSPRPHASDVAASPDA